MQKYADRLPRTQACFDLIGVFRGIAGGAKRLARQLRRRLMVQAAAVPPQRKPAMTSGRIVRMLRT